MSPTSNVGFLSCSRHFTVYSLLRWFNSRGFYVSVTDRPRVSWISDSGPDLPEFPDFIPRPLTALLQTPTISYKPSCRAHDAPNVPPTALANKPSVPDHAIPHEHFSSTPQSPFGFLLPRQTNSPDASASCNSPTDRIISSRFLLHQSISDAAHTSCRLLPLAYSTFRVTHQSVLHNLRVP